MLGLAALSIASIVVGMIIDAFWPSEEIKEKRRLARAEKDAADESGTVYGKNPYRFEIVAMFAFLAFLFAWLDWALIDNFLRDGASPFTLFSLLVLIASAGFYYLFYTAVKSCWRKCERRVSTGIPVDDNQLRQTSVEG